MNIDELKTLAQNAPSDASLAENETLKKFHETLDELRRDGVNKIADLKQEIAIVKKNKMISADEREKLISDYNAQIEKAKIVAANNKAADAELSKIGVQYANAASPKLTRNRTKSSRKQNRILKRKSRKSRRTAWRESLPHKLTWTRKLRNTNSSPLCSMRRIARKLRLIDARTQKSRRSPTIFRKIVLCATEKRISWKIASWRGKIMSTISKLRNFSWIMDFTSRFAFSSLRA